MHHDLRKHNWWSCMKRDITDFVAKCLKCQQVIYKHQTAGGAMQMIRILERKEECITVDFMTGHPLPLIWVSLILFGLL